jgi:hypothetical protein
MYKTYWHLLKKYYDSSTGVIVSNNFTSFDEFSINCGVKQGGILSPFLFNIFIDDLIHSCIDSNIGALFGETNVSILVYADDIILISPNDSHLQRLLNTCTQFSSDWLLKFNPNKSHIISFGKPIFPNTIFTLSNLPLTESNSIKYLGIEINSSLDYNTTACENFKIVQKTIFSLTYLGLTPIGVSPALKSFLYKTYCLSKFTYALETTILNKLTINQLNINQNNLIRQILGINKFSHMSNILQCMRIHNFEDLYILSKLSFLDTIKNNEIALAIFNTLCSDLENNHSRTNSFQKEIILLQKL